MITSWRTRLGRCTSCRQPRLTFNHLCLQEQVLHPEDQLAKQDRQTCLTAVCSSFIMNKHLDMLDPMPAGEGSAL